MKQFIKFIRAIVVLLSLNISTYAYDFEVDGIYYNILSSSELTVEVTYKKHYQSQYIWYATDGTPIFYSREKNYYACSYTGDLNIPSNVEYNGRIYSVIQIGNNAFSSSTLTSGYPQITCPDEAYNLLSITIPSSIKTIKESAFLNCKKLKSIYLPNNVERIEDSVFEGCNNIDNFSLPSSITHIGSYAFKDCSFWYLVIPKNVKTMGFYPFPDSLKELVMLPYNPPTPTKDYSTKIYSTSAEVFVPIKDKYMNNEYWNNNKLIEMLTPTSREFTYNGQKPTISWTNNLAAYTMTINNIDLQKDAGSYSSDVKADFYNGGQLAFSVEFPYEYTIKKASINVKANNAKREYGNDNPRFTASYSGFVGNDNESSFTSLPSLITTATNTSPVGNYPITITGGESNNYDFVCEPGVLTINKAPLTVKVNDATKTYGDQNPSFSLSYSGLKNNESVPEWTVAPTFSTSATISSDCSTYMVNVNCDAKNYDINKLSGTLTVNRAPLTIKANNTSRLYFEDNPEFSYTCLGFKNNDNESCLSKKPTFVCDADKYSNVGTYQVRISGAEGKNYTIGYENGLMEVTKRDLIITPDDAKRKYREENPQFTYKTTGFVNEEDESVFTSAPVVYTNANKTSDVGLYDIKVKDGLAENYKFAYMNGTLTIEKADQTIFWEQDLTELQVGDQVELLASASSGLSVEYVFSSDIVSLYNVGTIQYLDCLAEGAFSIRAIQNGNKNYNPAVRLAKNVVITNLTGIFDILSNTDNPIYIDMTGRVIENPQKGSIVIKINNGTRHKIMIK